MNAIQIEIDDDVAELLGDFPEQVSRRALEMIVLQFYRLRQLSSERASELLGLDRLVFVRWADSLGIPDPDATPEK